LDNDTKFPLINFKNNILKDLKISPLLSKYLNTEDFYKESFSFTPYFGADTFKYSLGEGQSQVLVESQKDKILIPVVGAPGTGKTTMFKSLIANSITKRALSIIENNKDYSNFTLLVSTANKAIDSVYSDILEENSMAKMFLILTSKNRTKESVSRISRFNIDNYIQYLNNKLISESIIDKKISKNNLKTQIIGLKEEILMKIKMFDFMKKLPYLISDLEKMENELDSILNENIEESKQCIEYINLLDYYYNGESEEFYLDFVNSTEFKNVSKLIESGILEFTKLDSFFDHFSNKKKKTIRLIVSSLNIPFKKSLNLSIEDIYNIYDLLINIKKTSSSLILKKNIYLKRKNIYEKKRNLLKEKQKSLELGVTEEIVDKYHTESDFFQKEESVFQLNYKLYKFSELYLAYIAKDNELELKDALERADHVRGGMKTNLSPKKPNAFDMSLISLVFPFSGTTTAKINITESNLEKNFRFPFPVNTLIVDEAGMVPSGDLIHSLNISQQAIIVGDPKQLPPISNIPQVLEKKLMLLSGVDKDFFDKYSPSEISCYHRAAEAQNGDLGIIGNGILLDEHRRCQKSIAELFKIVASYPKNLKIKTNKLEDFYYSKLPLLNGDRKNLEFYKVKADKPSIIKNTNINEIEIIELLLNKLQSTGYDIKSDIGIITPFRAQANKLVSKFKYILDHNEVNKKIGTVHSFQGAEFKVIIFSSVINNFSDSPSFVSDNIPLLNVSISRAKNLYIHVGDFDTLRGSSQIMDKYLNYFKTNGIIYDIGYLS
jgi:hypothetical protein